MRRHGIILDFNMLLLLIFAELFPEDLDVHRRSRNFGRATAEALQGAVAGVHLVLATQVLAETSNLIDSSRDWRGPSVHRALRSMVERNGEVRVPLLDVAGRPEFERLGLTDAVLLHLAERGGVLVSADDDLCLTAGALGLSCLRIEARRKA